MVKSKAKKKGRQEAETDDNGEPLTYDSTLLCDRCEQHIRVGLGGSKNLVLHQQHNRCKDEQKRLTTMRRRDDIWDAFKKRPTGGNVMDSSGPAVPLLGRQNPLLPPPMVPCSKALKILDEIHELAERLPETVPLGVESDEFAKRFGDLPHISASDAEWEVVDSALNNAFGSGRTSESVAAEIRRGRLGMECIESWLGCVIKEHGIRGNLLEGKLANLIAALRILTPLRDFEAGESLDENPFDGWVNSDTFEPTAFPPATSTVNNLLGEELAPIPCYGFAMPSIPGRSPYSYYPFDVHNLLNLEWEPRFHDGKFYAQSKACTERATAKFPCHPCRIVGGLKVLNNIMDRMEKGCSENTPFVYLGMQQKNELLRRQMTTIKQLRLSALNKAVTYGRRQTQVDDLKRLVVAIGSTEVPRVNTIVKLSLKNGSSPRAILKRIFEAANENYRAKSFTDSERHIAAIIFRMGGQRLLDIARRAFHLPSVSTTRRFFKLAPLIISAEYPTVAEIVENIRNHAQEGPIYPVTCGFGVMLDEIKINETITYDQKTNNLVGCCREHSDCVSKSFDSTDSLMLMHKAVRDKKTHIATEATVASFGAFSRDPIVYATRPILVSGTCKKEDADRHAELLAAIIEACAQEAKTVGGKLYCLSSDGCSMRGKALAKLTHISKLSAQSPIAKFLLKLPLLNLLCGENDLTSDKDWKHVDKRMRNTLLRESGVSLCGVLVTSAVIERHLQDNGRSAETVSSLLNVTDKQDVVLMYRLLVEIAKLPPDNDNANLNYRKTRSALIVLGKLFTALLEAYTSVQLSLHDQLVRLSFISHLFLLLFRKGKTAFIPIQLYNDTQIMIKNVFFCVAKTKIDDPNGEFFLILQGTDRLEDDFGNVRTCVGNNANADLGQLANRIIGAAECTAILAQHPKWNRGSRRKTLPSLLFEGVEVTAKYDHINPASWIGDVHVRTVDLRTCWASGRDMVEELDGLEDIDARAEFAMLEQERNPSHDILQPFGVFQDEADEGLDEVAVGIEGDEPNDTLEGGEGYLELDVEELAGLVAHEDDTDGAEANLGAATNKHSVYLEFAGGRMHKSSLCKAAFADFELPLSTDRLRRVRRLQRYNQPLQPLLLDESLDSERQPTLQVDDPAITMVYCETSPFLCIAKICGFRLEGRKLSSVTLAALREEGTTASYQIMTLVPKNPTPDDSTDWSWNFRLEGTAGKPLVLTVDGNLLLPVSPVVGSDPPECENGDVSPRWQFDTNDLLVFAAQLLELSRSTDSVLPHIPISETFPYRWEDNSLCFACRPDNDELDMQLSRDSCHLCQKNLNLSEGNKRLMHMGQHILFDGVVTRTSQPCGFCLGTDPLRCRLYLQKVNGRLQLDFKNANCPMKVQFKLANAEKYTKTNPCTNSPLVCPECPEVVWKYNLKYHLKKTHPNTNADRYSALYDISQDEIDGMQAKWKARKNKKGKRMAAAAAPLKISDHHSSGAALRDSVTREWAEDPERVAGAFDDASDQESEAESETSFHNDSDPAASDASPESPPATSSGELDYDGITEEDNLEADLHTSDWFGYIDEPDEPVSQPAISPIPSLNENTLAGPVDEAEAAVSKSLPATHESVQSVTGSDPAPTRTNEDTHVESLVVDSSTQEDATRRRTRSGQARRKREARYSADCICGDIIDEKEIEIAKEIVECAEPGCETRWFHLNCLKYKAVPKKFICKSCLPAKRGRK